MDANDQPYIPTLQEVVAETGENVAWNELGDGESEEIENPSGNANPTGIETRENPMESAMPTGSDMPTGSEIPAGSGAPAALEIPSGNVAEGTGEPVQGTSAKKPPRKKAKVNEGLPAENKYKNQNCTRALDKIIEKIMEMDSTYNTQDDPNRVRYYFKAAFNKYRCEKFKPEIEHFQAGEPFEDNDASGGSTTAAAAASGGHVTLPQLEECLKRFGETLSVLPSTSQRKNETTPRKDGPAHNLRLRSPAAALFPSPVASTNMPQKTNCQLKTCSFPNHEVWIGCKLTADKECNYWLHARCLGYPLATTGRGKNA